MEATGAKSQVPAISNQVTRSSPSGLLPSIPHYELHPLGDVTLHLGEPVSPSAFSCCTVLASTTHLSAASPVFRAMFTPNTWSESSFSSNADPSTRIVPFPDDDPQVLLILLNIAHLQFLTVPPTLTRRMLYQLAILCDKYDCLTLVAPWLQRWINHHQFGGVYHSGDAFICWTFGLESMFEACMRKLIMETRFDVEAGVLVRGGVVVPSEDEIMPGDALGESFLCLCCGFILAIVSCLCSIMRLIGCRLILLPLQKASAQSGTVL